MTYKHSERHSFSGGGVTGNNRGRASYDKPNRLFANCPRCGGIPKVRNVGGTGYCGVCGMRLDMCKGQTRLKQD